MVRPKQLIKCPTPATVAFKTVDNVNNYNLSSVRFSTGEKAFDDPMNACILSAEASDFAPETLRGALSDYISSEEQVKYRIDVSYLQSTLLGGRFLLVEYQISSVGKNTTYSSRRVLCLDTVTKTRLAFNRLIPANLPWTEEAIVTGSNYYNLSKADPSDIQSFVIKPNGDIVLTVRLTRATLITDTKAAMVTVDSSCFDWVKYKSF
jgi:hypothetical protein